MNASRAALLYGGLLCLLYALVPTLSFPNPPLDVVEGFAWGRDIQLGYTKHPPMQAWLLELSYHLTGGHAYGAYWLSAISIGIGYWFVWLIGKELGFSGQQRFWAIVLTSVTFYFTLPVPEFNPNILQIPVWAGMVFFFLRALNSGAVRYWILLGAVAAIGFYTKYFIFLLIGTIGLYALVYNDGRRYLATSGPWICSISFLLLVGPHLYWLYETDFLTFRYAIGRSNAAGSLFDHVYNPINFLLAQLANHAGLFLVALLGFSWQTLKSAKASWSSSKNADLTAQADRFLVWFAFVPLAVVLLASAITGSEFKHMWGTPLFVLSGLVAVRYFHLPAFWSAPKRAFTGAIVIQAIFLGVLFGQAVLEPLWKTKQSRIHYPGKAAAEFLSDVWEKETGTELAYVAGDEWTTANVTLHAASRPSMFLEHNTTLSPWIDLDDVQKKGVMILWRGENSGPAGRIMELYPNASRQGQHTLPFHSYGTFPDLTINWIIVPPGSVATSVDDERTD
jgi:4-amino-4-deoxy-L-arabinose transferase-like glycosyltransferase